MNGVSQRMEDEEILSKVKSDGQKTQDHASYNFYEYSNEKKTTRLKSQKSKKYQVWLWSATCVSHIRKIN